MLVYGIEVFIDGHKLNIPSLNKSKTEDIHTFFNIVEYLINEGFLDRQMWCQENGIF